MLLFLSNSSNLQIIPLFHQSKASSRWFVPRVHQNLILGLIYLASLELVVVIGSQVNSAFNGKRKMLKNTLQHIRTPPEIEEALRSMDLPATVSSNIILLRCPFREHTIFELKIHSNAILYTMLEQSRPEELTLNDFVKLHNSLVIADLDAP